MRDGRSKAAAAAGVLSAIVVLIGCSTQEEANPGFLVLGDGSAVAITNSGLVLSQDYVWSEINGLYPLPGYMAGINESGITVGTQWDAEYRATACVWDSSNGVQILGTLGGSSSYGVAINNVGQVVGSSHKSTPGTHAFLWDPTSGMMDLGSLDPLTNDYSEATAINDNSQVAGVSTVPSGDRHAFLWDADSGMRDVGVLGFDLAYLQGNYAKIFLNNAGQLAFSTVTDQDTIHACIWEPDTGLLDLGALNQTNSYAVDMNSSGQVVGVCTPGSVGFIWDAENGLRQIGSGIEIYALNDAGQVIGNSASSNNCFIWDQDNGFVFPGSAKGTYPTFFVDINNSGQVVGTYHEPRFIFPALVTVPEPYFFLWEE